VHANLIYDSLDSPHSLPQAAFRSVSLFFRADAAFSLYVTLSHPFSNKKITPSLGKTWTPSNSPFLGPQTGLPHARKNGTSIESAVFFPKYSRYQRTDRRTDRQNKHAVRPVSTGRATLSYGATRPNHISLALINVLYCIVAKLVFNKPVYLLTYITLRMCISTLRAD